MPETNQRPEDDEPEGRDDPHDREPESAEAGKTAPDAGTSAPAAGVETADDSADEDAPAETDASTVAPSRREFWIARIKEAAADRRQMAKYAIALIATVVLALLVGRRGGGGFEADTDATVAPKVLLATMLEGFPTRRQRDLVAIEREYEAAVKAAAEAEAAGFRPRDVRRRQPAMFAIDAIKFPVTDEMTKMIADLDPETKAMIDTVIFDSGKITDDGLAAICSLPNLQHLRLRLSPITDRGFEMLAGCKKLWFLNLPHCDCTMEGVAALQAIPALRQLRLGSDRLDNEAPRAITKIKSLRMIHLIGVPVTNGGMKAIADMENLESLYLDDSAVTEAGWDWLFENRPHLHVHVNQQHLDRDPAHHRH